jgi:hypothetical protein
MPLAWALKIQNEANTFKTKCPDPAVVANAAAQVWPIACLA